MEFDQRKVATLAGTIVLAGALVAAAFYGPSAWKVLRSQPTNPDQVVIQTPPVDAAGTNATVGSGAGGVNPANPAVNTNSNPATSPSVTTGKAAPAATISPPTINTAPQGDASGTKKYKEPDLKFLDPAPSIAGFFSSEGVESGLSDATKTLAFGSAWNIHEYVDGYLFGPTAGPQMNEQDIKKYILFHKTLWDKQLKNEVGANKVMAFSGYLDVLFNRGMDAFDSKDKARIEQFHQEIHDLDSHLFRNDTSAKIYGATPFATKR
ncbi:MAG: hypothetical protein WA131_02280 [Desulfitobacteriaceae bacterium]